MVFDGKNTISQAVGKKKGGIEHSIDYQCLAKPSKTFFPYTAIHSELHWHVIEIS